MPKNVDKVFRSEQSEEIVRSIFMNSVKYTLPLYVDYNLINIVTNIVTEIDALSTSEYA